MNLITTVPANRQFDIGVYSFGALPTQNPSFVNLTIKHSGTVITGFYFSNSTSLQSVSVPNIVCIDPNNIQAGGISVQACSSLTSFSVPLLQKTGGDVVAVSTAAGTLTFPSFGTCGGDFAVGSFSMVSFSAPLLTFTDRLEFVASGDCCSFPALQHMTGSLNAALSCLSYQGTTASFPLLSRIDNNSITIGFCPNLRNINLSSWLPTNGIQYFFTNDPQLTSATTNALLARCVASTGYVSGTIGISGTPTGQGVTDKATLQGRGVTVITN